MEEKQKLFWPGFNSKLGRIGRYSIQVLVIQTAPSRVENSDEVCLVSKSLSMGWGGEMPHATMPRAILAHATLAHATLPHWYKIYCVCRILLKWRIVIFSSQNVIMAHCYSFILVSETI